MTHVMLTETQRDHAAEIAARIGAAARAARQDRGLSIHEVAIELDAHASTLSGFERGVSPNVKVGNVAKFLGHYGLTLIVVPIESAKWQAIR